MAGSSCRVAPLQVQTSQDDRPPSAAQRSLLAPKSPLHGARSQVSTTGFDRLLLLRNMNVSVPISGAEPSGNNTRPSKPATGYHDSMSQHEDEVSAAHNLKARKLAEARRRVEVQLMAREDYTATPEGDARLRRQDERARMQEEELRMQRIVQHDKAQRRAAQLQKQAEDEARVKEMFLARRRQELEEQARVAAEKDAERKRVLEAKMRALKEDADRKAREAYAARQQQLAEEAQAERDTRTAAVESVLMHVEDELAHALRVEWLADQERRRQIEAEALEWLRFEEQEAQRQREETQRRRDAQREQYEQDRARRMQIHRLQQERAAQKRRREQDQQGANPGGSNTNSAAATLQRLRSQCEPAVDVPPIAIAPGSSPTLASSGDNPQPPSPGTARSTRQLTARRVLAPATDETTSVLSAIAEQTHVPPPPALAPGDLDVAPLTTVSVAVTESDEPRTVSRTHDDDAGGSLPNDDTGENLASVTHKPPSTEVTGTSRDDPTEAAPVTSLTATEGPDPAFSEATGNAVIATDTQPSEVRSQCPTSDPIASLDPMVILPELLPLHKLRADGVLPVAEVLSVTIGSPSSVAGLAPRDLLVEFGGITSATPACIVAIASCVQQHVGQRIALTVLRPVDPAGVNASAAKDALFQQCELWLVPRKWKGKGLLGCQLSPFKWPALTSAHQPQGDGPVQGDESAQGEYTPATTSYDALVLHQVTLGSLAHRLGMLDGDVLARCGDVDVSRAGASAADALAAVVTLLQTQWRDAQRELSLVLQRWDETAQSYAVVHVILPIVSDPDEPLGCTLTTYTEYYYPLTSAPSAVVACEECYYTSLPSSLHAAALSGHVACLEATIMACSPEFLDWRDEEGRSPLFYACYARQADVTRCLVAHLMATLGAYDPVAGADAYGDSPLHAAAASDCVDAIDTLLATKFITDVNLTNGISQATAAHVAASEASLRVLHARFGADLLALDADGRMPLFYACLRNDPASTAFLCELHPEFADYADSAGGNTPLHMAAWCGFREVVRTLVASLPSIALFMPNQDGLDPRALAEQNGYSELASELERLMANA